MSVWEWMATGLLGLQAAAVTWLVKDYFKFRLTTIPTFITETKCLRCEEALRQDLAEIKRHMEAGQGQFKAIAVTLARLCAKLGVPGPSEGV